MKTIKFMQIDNVVAAVAADLKMDFWHDAETSEISRWDFCAPDSMRCERTNAIIFMLNRLSQGETVTVESWELRDLLREMADHMAKYEKIFTMIMDKVDE